MLNILLSQFQRIFKGSMEDIQDVHFVELENSKYLKPIRMKYKQAIRNYKLNADMLNTHNMSTRVLEYNDLIVG